MSEMAEPGLTSGGLGVLSDDARELYRRVLRANGRLAPSEAGLSRSPHLDELLDIGLLVPDTDEPGMLVAVDPRQLSENLATTWQRKALDLLTRAVALPTDLKDLTEAFHTPEQSGGTIEYVRGKVLINQRLQQLTNGCTQEFLAAQPGGPRPPDALAGSIARDLELLRRGAVARTIYHPSTRYHPPTRDYVATIAQAGGQVRTLDEPYTRILVIDRHTAIIPVADDLNVAAFIHDQAVISYLVTEVFERNWSRAIEFDGTSSVPQQVVSRLRKTIIDLLLKGTSHRVIARSLGISERTLARHIADMREDYQVDSLFQLGYVLARTTPAGPDSTPFD
ncbi:helix-turn-helix domain-containing protein [Kitasatospora sp. GP82]|uniref:TrmB family transcriptional regulator n=1 Tax=Kitasatospora sp. GP82 TaxID=3035089 RepID=UPI0024769879|nr:helix-turn-helix domain-containing protein [Kitasatospora sp. GP82]MDH6123673.1 biotin operon repressor/sugar-specific transcriptional regulator TrmB [Kitasatospora sp. GP82]